ncbi:Lon protease family protein [Chakrabartyella piscis]|uniref:Lon protease family protein n=1 Tax=Chakrabartyella piscis TaxID=2918914 RepID=UPI002958504E|nr:AAA family ATPase [Chakrabartyella piscis]
MNELDYTQLKHRCDPNQFSFATTKELEPSATVFGQDRGVKAFDFGLQVKLRGYNIYMAGTSGTGKTTYAKASATKLALTESTPKDWCYVYNFKAPREPLALSFVAGDGSAFQKDMSELVALIKVEVKRAFADEDYHKQKSNINRMFEAKKEEFLEKMNQDAAEFDFLVKSQGGGVYFLPVVEGKPIGEEEYEELTDAEKERIEENSQGIQENVAGLLRDIKDLDRETKKQMERLEYKIGMLALGGPITEIQERYSAYPEAMTYLQELQEDVLEHLSFFYEEEESSEDDMTQLLPMMHKKPQEDITLNYRVNLLVDNSKTKGAPVVESYNPTAFHLAGEVEYDTEYGNLITDFMKIKGGLLHKANGGYLIVQAQDVLSNPLAWETLRRVIKTKEIQMDGMREQVGIAIAPTLKPQSIPVDVKVIMVGNNGYYELLREYDEEFDKFFKVKVDFDYEMPRTSENVEKICGFIKGFVERENTLDFDVSAICKVVEESSRLVERQNKMSTKLNYLVEILGESITWATIAGAEVVSKEHVERALFEKKERLCLYQEKLEELYDDDVILMDVSGSQVGQINGLAVLDLGNHAFGIPSRITATTCIGQSGIVNIEKEAQMSGQTHDKGVQIVAGYLGQTYAQEFPLSLSCRVCFEQNYNGIDGDSASSTELYCILSSLSKLPIRQDLAVTGSVNQKGEIQAIGGVTLKIEGFFDLCAKRGLTGTQGVLIPKANVRDLMLEDRVIDAVKEGKFHIYAISHLEEGIALLMGKDAGVLQEDGTYPKDTVHGMVLECLRKFYQVGTSN